MARHARANGLFGSQDSALDSAFFFWLREVDKSEEVQHNMYSPSFAAGQCRLRPPSMPHIRMYVRATYVRAGCEHRAQFLRCLTFTPSDHALISDVMQV